MGYSKSDASKCDSERFRGGQNHKIFAEGEIMKLTPAARRLMTVLNDGPHSLDELAAISRIYIPGRGIFSHTGEGYQIRLRSCHIDPIS